MYNPLVSIIIPVYNAEKYIEQCIQSALRQTWSNIEVIIVDDGSTDKSLSIVKAFGQKIRIFTQINKGASAARNKGLMEAMGVYIQFLDADDFISLDKIESQLKQLNGSEEYLCLCKTVYFKDNDDILSFGENEWYKTGSNDPTNFLLKLYSSWDIMPGYGGMIQPNAWLTPTSIIQKAGTWNEELSVDDDGEFFCRIVLASKGIKFSKGGINYYRKHANKKSLSTKKNEDAFESNLFSIDLKYQHLKQRYNSDLLDLIFSRHYWELGVSTYPQFKKLSKHAIKRSKELNFGDHRYNSGRLGVFFAKLFGWRVARTMSYLRYK